MVNIEIHGSVCTITINRPDVRNAVDAETAAKLVNAFNTFEANSSLKVAVLTGQGEHFCSGADLTAIAEGRGNRIEVDGDGPMGPSRMHLSKPVICAISGYAVAGGLELALWCDLRVADETAILGVFCRRWGVPLIDGGTVRLPRLVGLSHAMDLILTGRPVDAPEALSIGLVNRVVPKGQALQSARSLAQSIASFPQQCMLADRESAYQGMSNSFGAALEYEFRQGLRVLAEESVPGAKRFSAGAGRRGRFDDYWVDHGMVAHTDTQDEDT